jgi:hypothetical protein
MDREAIRNYALILADEYDLETGEGLFNETAHNILINISQNRVVLDVGRRVPLKFRKQKLITITANLREYTFTGDLAITDFLAFHSILHNVTGYRATPLLEIDLEDEWQYEDMDELSYWGYEDKDRIFIGPVSSSTTASRLKSFYFPEQADLAGDTSIPAMPNVCHPLIAIDVLRQFTVADEGSLAKMEILYEREVDRIVEALSMKSNFKESGSKRSIREVLTSRDA